LLAPADCYLVCANIDQCVCDRMRVPL
jgi:hypothetical protein